jgi:hypothetical protein
MRYSQFPVPLSASDIPASAFAVPVSASDIPASASAVPVSASDILFPEASINQGIPFPRQTFFLRKRLESAGFSRNFAACLTLTKKKYGLLS